MFSPSPITTVNPEIAGKQQIARIARRIIARNYGLIDQILNIIVEPTGLIKVWFQDDNVERSVILMSIGETIEYQDVSSRRNDSVTNIDRYIVGYANAAFIREDAIRKPKNCKKGLPCKGECIPKTSVCRDIPVAKDEAIAINEAIANSKPQQVVPSPKNEDPYGDLNIRQLKEVAREKGIVRYSYMTMDQLKTSIKIVDENPDYQENIRKTVQKAKDESNLKKGKQTAIGRAISLISPTAGRQFNIFAGIARKYESNPVEARILGVAATIGLSVVAAKIAQKRFNDNIPVAAAEAEKLAEDRLSKVNVGKKESSTFLVGNYKTGGSGLERDLNSASAAFSKEDKDWLKNETNVIKVKRTKEGTTGASDPIGFVTESVTDGYKATIGNMLNAGKNPEAVSLAADIFNQGRVSTKVGDKEILPAINVLATEDGGLVAREAMQILGKMKSVSNGKIVRGMDIASRVELVTVGTPYFGLTDKLLPENNIMGDGDPWNSLTPFKRGGAFTSQVTGVKGGKQKDYFSSAESSDRIFQSLKKNLPDRIKVLSQDKPEDTGRPTVVDEIKGDLDVILKEKYGNNVDINSIPPNELTAAINKAKRQRQAKKEREQVVNTSVEVKPDSFYTVSFLEARLDANKKLNCKAGNKQCGNACVSSKLRCKEDPLKSSPIKRKSKALEDSATIEKDGEGLKRPNITTPLLTALAGAGIFYGATQLVGENGEINLKKAAEVKDEVGLALTLRYQDVLQASGFRGVLPKTLNARDEEEFLANKDYIESKAKEVLKSIPERKYALGDEAITNDERLTYIGKLLEDPLRKDEFKFSLFKAKSVQGTNPEDIAAIRHYSGTKGYKEMNMTARGLHKELLTELRGKWDDKRSPDQIKQDAFADIRMANSGLDSLPAYKGTTYRGLTLSKELTNTLQIGEVWKESGFTSTTKNPLGLYPGNVIMRIKSSSGRDISSFEKYPNNEVLFKTNTDFVVTGRKKIKRFGKEFYLIDLKDSVSKGDKGKIEKVEKNIAYNLSDKVLEKAKSNEAKVTPLLNRLSTQNNMRLEGLEYKFKEKESIARKIRDRANTSLSGSISFNESAKKQADSLNDGLRYTLVSPSAKYNENIAKIRSEFKAKGYSEAKYWDAWSASDIYKGVNITFKNNSDKSLFEVQVHTKESFLAKQEIHPLYESFRSAETRSSEKKKLLSEMRRRMKSLKKPK